MKLEKSLPPKLKINVGGLKFVTTLDTLKSHPGSFFAVLLSGKWNVDETIFINRDGSVFSYVLNFMRGEPLDLSSLSPSKFQLLQKDAEFFQLDQLVSLLNSSISLNIFSSTLKSRRITISNGNEVLLTHYGHSGVLSKEEYNKGTILFQFEIVTAASWLFIGVGTHVPQDDNFFVSFLSNTTKSIHANSYGWAGGKEVYSKGQLEMEKDGYTSNITPGDEVTLLLDCNNNFLLFKNDTKKSKAFMLQLPAGVSWRLQLNLHTERSRVKLLRKTVL